MSLSQFKLNFEINPIILTGGTASGLSGSSVSFLEIIGDNPDTLDNAFAHFKALPQSSLIAQSIATYPFANQQVAANAVVAQPLLISLLMMIPMRGNDAWAVKLARMSSLQATLKKHNNAGGTYIVLTPAQIYTDLVMEDLTDISNAEDAFPQNGYKWTFSKPLISLSDAQNAQNSMMDKLTKQIQSSGDQTGGGSTSDVTSNYQAYTTNPVGPGSSV